jgi:hypothetical protein
MQQIVIHPLQAYRAISRMYKGRKNYQHTEEQICIYLQVHVQLFEIWFRTFP